MSNFKNWLEQQDGMELSPQKEEEAHEIWDQIFKRMAGQQNRSEVSTKTLSDLTHNRRPGKSATQAILDQISPLLQQLGSNPEYAPQVKDAESWLGQEREDGAPDRTLGDLLGIIFKDKHELWLNDKGGSDTDTDQLQKAPPAAPLDSAMPTEPDQSQPTQPQPNPNAVMMPQQPQVPDANPMMPRPTNPMPPRPIGAGMGLY